MGLRVDRLVDERRDPVKSTQAAAKYLSLFHERLGSWPLALAAYNAGDGPVMKAVRRHGTKDFWELCRRGALPGRTRAYVPKVLAAMHIMHDLDAYGFSTSRESSVYDFESIKVQEPLGLEEVAGWLDVPVDRMRELNPSLRTDRVPTDSDFALRLPSGARDRFDLAYEGYLRK
jgi:membrane-bound lytic murein transglycosylase D